MIVNRRDGRWLRLGLLSVVTVVLCGCDNEADRLQTVSTLTDPNLLVEAALKDRGWVVAEAALRRLSLKRHFEQIARKAQNSEVREHALSLLTDDDVLADIALDESNVWVSLTATKCITGRDALERVFQNSQFPAVRVLANYRRMTGAESECRDRLKKHCRAYHSIAKTTSGERHEFLGGRPPEMIAHSSSLPEIIDMQDVITLRKVTSERGDELVRDTSRLAFFVMDPRVHNRLGSPPLRIRVEGLQKSYSSPQRGLAKVQGERIIVVVNAPFACEKSTETLFTPSVHFSPSQLGVSIRAKSLDTMDMISSIVEKVGFDPEDLLSISKGLPYSTYRKAVLSHASPVHIPEVLSRNAEDATDAGFLESLAANSTDSDLQRAARWALTSEENNQPRP